MRLTKAVRKPPQATAMKPVAMQPVARRTTGRQAVPLVGLAPGLRRLHPFELQAEAGPARPTTGSCSPTARATG